MRKKYITQWDPEKGFAYVRSLYNGQYFEGQAQVHPEDKDFMSEKIGLTIADLRMLKNLYQHEKNRSYNTYLILDRLVRILENNGKINKEDYVLQEVIKERDAALNKFYEDSNNYFQAEAQLKYYLYSHGITIKKLKNIRNKDNNSNNGQN